MCLRRALPRISPRDSDRSFLLCLRRTIPRGRLLPPPPLERELGLLAEIKLGVNTSPGAYFATDGEGCGRVRHAAGGLSLRDHCNVDLAISAMCVPKAAYQFRLARVFRVGRRVRR
jgi:hypothetical protein